MFTGGTGGITTIGGVGILGGVSNISSSLNSSITSLCSSELFSSELSDSCIIGLSSSGLSSGVFSCESFKNSFLISSVSSLSNVNLLLKINLSTTSLRTSVISLSGTSLYLILPIKIPSCFLLSLFNSTKSSSFNNSSKLSKVFDEYDSTITIV